MAVSVIVSNFNGAKYLPKLLETLTAQRNVEFEIIIVDRNSTDDSPNILANWPAVRIVSEPPETGLVTGYAIGAEHARHDQLFFCNEDMWFEPYCLARLSRELDETKGIVAADPWQWTYDGAHWIHGGTRFDKCFWGFSCPYPFRRFAFTEPLACGATIPFGCAGAILITKHAYEAVGGWDRQFFLDQEDVDLFLRVWQKGWKCVVVPEAKVYHAVNVSNAKTLQGGRQKVSKRRYISGRSSISIIGLKHFSLSGLWLPFACWLLVFVKDLLHSRSASYLVEPAGRARDPAPLWTGMAFSACVGQRKT